MRILFKKHDFLFQIINRLHYVNGQVALHCDKANYQGYPTKFCVNRSEKKKSYSQKKFRTLCRTEQATHYRNNKLGTIFILFEHVIAVGQFDWTIRHTVTY